MGRTDQEPWNGSLEAISQQGFKQEDGLKGFGVRNQQTFSRDEVCQTEVTILDQSPKGEGKRQKGHLVRDLAGSVIRNGTITKRL
jgi:hypothetical protein